MAGSGVRAARYLAQAGADEVWANDGNAEGLETMCGNLFVAAGVPTALEAVRSGKAASCMPPGEVRNTRIPNMV
jgi:tRNA G26 N,N-dimethylase Trm1